MAPKRHHHQQQRALALPALSAALLLLLAAAAATLPAPARAARPWSPPPTKTPPPTGQHHYRPNNNHHHNNKDRFGRFFATPTGCNTTNVNIPRSTDKVNVWEETCAASANTGCGSCSLYRLVEKRANATQTYIYTAGGPYGRSKIVPVKPMAGLESIVNGAASTSSFWAQALTDAQAGKIDNVPQTNHPVAYANSLDARDEHQLHVHIGRVDSKKDLFFECAHAAFIDAPPGNGNWRTLDSKRGACGALALDKGHNVTMAATTAPASGIDAAIRDGFKAPKVPGTKAGAIDSDAVLLRTGVLVQQTAKGDYLVVLVSNTDDHLIFGY
jgi:hypothetical protein